MCSVRTTGTQPHAQRKIKLICYLVHDYISPRSWLRFSFTYLLLEIITMPPSEVARQHSTQLLPMYKRPILRTFTSSKKVRSKFFQRIGILCSMNKAPSVSLAERSVRDLRNVPRFNEPLHYSYNHHEEEEQREPQQSEGKKGVNFQETVTVVPWVVQFASICVGVPYSKSIF